MAPLMIDITEPASEVLDSLTSETVRAIAERSRLSLPIVATSVDQARERLAGVQRAFPSVAFDAPMQLWQNAVNLRAVWQLGLGFAISEPANAELLRGHDLNSRCLRITHPFVAEQALSLLGPCDNLIVHVHTADELRLVESLPTNVTLVFIARVDVGQPRPDLELGLDADTIVEALASLPGERLIGLSATPGALRFSAAHSIEALGSIMERCAQPIAELHLGEIGEGAAPGDAPDADETWSINRGLELLPYEPARISALLHRSALDDLGVVLAEVVHADADDVSSPVRLGLGEIGRPQIVRATPGTDSETSPVTRDDVVLDWFGRDVAVVEERTIVNDRVPGTIVAEGVGVPVGLEPREQVVVRNLDALPAASVVDADARILDPRHPYEIVLPADDHFEAVCAVELESFRAAGFADADGSLESVRRFDDMSRMVVVPSAAEPLGVLRIVEPGDLGYATFHSLPLTGPHSRIHRMMDFNSAVEVATSAPLNRDPVVALQLYRAVMLDCLVRGKRYIVAGMDDAVLEGINRRFEKDGLRPFMELGPSKHYMGSGSTAILGDVWQAAQSLDLVNQFTRSIERVEDLKERRAARAGI